MAKISREVYVEAKNQKLPLSKVAEMNGVTRQAVFQMFKKYENEDKLKLIKKSSKKV